MTPCLARAGRRRIPLTVVTYQDVRELVTATTLMNLTTIKTIKTLKT
jgi:hypothetical protein